MSGNMSGNTSGNMSGNTSGNTSSSGNMSGNTSSSGNMSGNTIYNIPAANTLLKATQQQLPDASITNTPNMTNAINNNNKNTITNSKKNKDETDNIISKLLSSNFIKYIMDYINTKITLFTNAYSNSSMGNGNDTKNINDTFNLENNMIPAGLLLFVLSMLLYFIDVTS